MKRGATALAGSRTPAPVETTRAPRIAVFTHDTYGLGHVRRSLHIIRTLVVRAPGSAVLLITGSPALHAFRELPGGVDVLKIPTLVQTGTSANQPPHLSLSCRQVSAIRKRVIRSAVEAFRPDLLLVDNFPLGSRKELLPTLERLRELRIPAVLGLRDIVDLPEVVRETWAKERIYAALDFYDRILVYGLREVLAVEAAYGLGEEQAAKVRYCGYVTSADPPRRSVAEIHAELGLRPPIVLATVGGGGDGFPLLDSFVAALERLDGLSAVVVTGPLMAPDDRQRIARTAADVPRVVVREYVPDLPAYLAAADLVVAMGGYNTTAELLASRRPAVIMPRNWRYGEYANGTDSGVEWEQLLRARAMQRLGLVDVLEPGELTPDFLAAKIRAALRSSSRVEREPPDLGGVQRVIDQLFQVMPQRVHDGQLSR